MGPSRRNQIITAALGEQNARALEELMVKKGRSRDIREASFVGRILNKYKARSKTKMTG